MLGIGRWSRLLAPIAGSAQKQYHAIREWIMMYCVHCVLQLTDSGVGIYLCAEVSVLRLTNASNGARAYLKPMIDSRFADLVPADHGRECALVP